MSRLPWPACVVNPVPGLTTVPVNDSPIGQKQFVTSTPLIFPARSHAKLKHWANVFILIGEAGQLLMGAAVFLGSRLQLFISCGMCRLSEYSDHRPLSTGTPLTISGGSEQWPGPNGSAILPPVMSPIEGPGNIGQMHLASGKDAVPSVQPGVPASHLTSIVPPVGVHIEAAQSAKSPGQSRIPSAIILCDMTWGTARRIAPIKDETTKAYRNMCFSLLSFMF